MPRKKRYRTKPKGILAYLLSLIFIETRQKQITALRTILPTNAGRPIELLPHELEQLATHYYSKIGYRNVKHTGVHSSTDGGVDVWMLSPSGNVEIVQCKQLNNRVSRTDMIAFAKTIRQQHAELGHFWAPGGFSQPAIDYAKENKNIYLYEDYQIRKLLEKLFENEQGQVQDVAVQSKARSGWQTWQIFVLFTLGILAASSACCLLSYILSR